MSHLKKGAEADVSETTEGILKYRVSKGYRVKELDLRLRKMRTKAEANTLRKLRSAGVHVPAVIKEDLKKYSLLIEKIDGSLVKDALTEHNHTVVARKIAEQIAAIHELDIVHGDLTTSNMMLSKERIVLIDFGLSYTSLKVEDKAVDLHLLEETLESTHTSFGKKMFAEFLAVYRKRYSKGKDVVARLESIRKKGRYKEHD